MMNCNDCSNKIGGVCCHSSIKPSSLIDNIKSSVLLDIDRHRDAWAKQHGGGLFDELDAAISQRGGQDG